MQKPLVFEIEDLGWGGCHFINNGVIHFITHR